MSDTESTRMPLRIQPFGITFQPVRGGDLIAIANYLAPAQHIGFVTVSRGQLTRRLGTISGVLHGITWRRGGFPDIDNVAQTNRCWTAILDVDGTSLFVGRGEAEFFKLTLPADEQKWRVVDRLFVPRVYGQPYAFVACGAILQTSPSRLVTVEHDSDYVCAVYVYRFTPNETLSLIKRFETLGRFRYGIAWARFEGKEGPVSVTAFHAEDAPGIYFCDTCIVAGLYGDSICPLSNGGALATKRGMESPKGDALQEPGALIYLPPTLFPMDFAWVRQHPLCPAKQARGAIQLPRAFFFLCVSSFFLALSPV